MVRKRLRSLECLLPDFDELKVWKSGRSSLEEGNEEMQPFSGEKDLKSARP